MSKYEKLWEYIKEANQDSLVLNFKEIEKIVGIPIDHSFLNYKKELIVYGFIVKKISLNNKTVIFEKNK